MLSYVVEISTPAGLVSVEFPAANTDDAIDVAARIVRRRIDDLPLDETVCVRLAEDENVLVKTTVEQMACRARL